uniref:Death domain-containing protein n=1 Tax=Amphimedon queenslandica TaxID=400682 RepID=A0A1X7V2G3_AMPQE
MSFPRSFSGFLSSPPFLSELIEQVDVGTKWYLLGTLLHVDNAAHSNYKHLELFVTVLRKFSETARIGDTIFEEYRKHFCYYDDDVKEKDIYLAKQPREKFMSTSSESSSFDDKEIDRHGDHKILFPRNMKKKFEDMRMRFGSTFFQVRRIFARMKNVNIDEVMYLISDMFPDLKPQLSDKKTINDVLNVLQRKCNIINLRPLEVLVFEFNIEDAKPVIKLYKEEAKDFCKSISVSLCLDEKLQAVATPSRLLCETVVFVFNWDPDEYTLQDINDVLDELELLDKCRIQIDKVGTGLSVIVTCYCPAEYTGLLKSIVLEKIDMLQRKGLKEFIVGNLTVWDATQVKNTEVMELLAQVSDLKTALKDRDERIMATETELAKVKEQSEIRLKEIETLQKDLEESRYINAHNEEVINQLKENVSSLNKKVSVLKEKLINSNYSILEEDTEKELASSKEHSETRLQEIEQLKLKLEDNNRLQVPVEETSETIKDESSDDDTSSNEGIVMKPDDKSLTVNLQEDGMVMWSFDGIRLTSPSVDQCKEVICKLKKENWWIILRNSSSDSIQVLIPAVLERRIINELTIYSSLLSRDDVLSFSSQLSTNKSLSILHLTHGSMSDDGVIALAQSLRYNKTLESLFLDHNPGITSACAQSLAELLLTNNTLHGLYLNSTNIDTDGVMILMESLKTNNTLRNLKLSLDKQHKEPCSALPYYEYIKDRLNFVEF